MTRIRCCCVHGIIIIVIDRAVSIRLMLDWSSERITQNRIVLRHQRNPTTATTTIIIGVSTAMLIGLRRIGGSDAVVGVVRGVVAAVAVPAFFWPTKHHLYNN